MRRPAGECFCTESETCPVHDNAAWWFAFVLIAHVAILGAVMALIWAYI